MRASSTPIDGTRIVYLLVADDNRSTLTKEKNDMARIKPSWRLWLQHPIHRFELWLRRF